MKASVLSQGITTSTNQAVGTTLIGLLSKDDFQTFTGISAFASESGITILTPYFVAAKQRGAKLRLIVGIDQQATSKEALEAILALDIEAYVFYQTGFSIFHPKIYLFEGAHTAQLIVGSSNLTAQGIFVNVEGSIYLELALDQAADVQLITDLKTQFPGLYDLTDPNLQPITQGLIDKLVAEKVVPTEVDRRAAQAKARAEEPANATDDAARVIPTLFPKRALLSVPAAYRPKKKAPAAPVAAIIAAASASGATYTLMWAMARACGQLAGVIFI